MSARSKSNEEKERVDLPPPRFEGRRSVEAALEKRRSIRECSDAALTLQETAQLLWAAQGVTNNEGGRTAPSAGALYPLEVYLAAGRVEGLAVGAYHYEPKRHELTALSEGDPRADLAKAALAQECVRDAAIVITLAAVFSRVTKEYGNPGIRYTHYEVGHAAQNVLLQATALDLGTVVVGAFHAEPVKRILRMSDAEEPLYMVAAGRMK
jgi:SagB-type dehydrogenase family enzyme